MKKNYRQLAVIVPLLIIFGTILTLYLYSKSNSNEGGEKGKNIVTTYRSTIKSNPYSLHVATGKKLIGKPLKNKEAIDKAYREGKVVKVKNSTGVLIDNLTHSFPYLQKDAAILLMDIGKEFSKKSSGDRMLITSLTRPTNDQTKLTKSNPNASPNTSSHSYGVSFDIAYTKFNSNRKYSHDAHKALEEILKKFQAENRLYIIREKQSACYHVTVRK